MVDVPEKIWIKQDDCPYFYEESELAEVGSPVTEYIRADLCRRPEPAPCDELETVATQVRLIGDDHFRPFKPLLGEKLVEETRELVTRQNAEEVIAAKDKEIADLQQLLEERRNTIASLIPRAPNCGRYLAECNDGQLMYLNHAGKWQECPNFITEKDARIAELEADNKRLREALEVMLVPYEGSDCRRDHHGYCQEHFLEEDCCVAKARAALGE